jgi:hypothetical protein
MKRESQKHFKHENRRKMPMRKTKIKMEQHERKCDAEERKNMGGN